MSWELAVSVYLLAGLSSLGVVLVQHLRAKRSLQEWKSGLRVAEPASASRWHQVALDKVVVPLLASCAVVIAWPLALALVVRGNRQESPVGEAASPVFVVLGEHLIAPLDLDDIEELETVDDPLAAVPDLPFGHLNAKWRIFRSGLGEGEEVWSFLADWTDRPGEILEMSGYVAVSNGVPGRFILTGRHPFLD